MQVPEDAPNLDGERLIDSLCDRFDAAWHVAAESDSTPPRLENFLDEIDEPLRDDLFNELLVVELECRRESRLDALLPEYVNRFPHRLEAVNRNFATYQQEHEVDELPPANADPDSTGDFTEFPTVISEAGNTQLAWPNSDSNHLNEKESTQPEVPKRLNRYRVIEVLGKGGFGIVYLAEDEKLNRLVALKVPRPGNNRVFSRSVSQWTKEFEAEAGKVAALHNPHIVPVFDIVELEDGRPMIVSRYIDGSDLNTRLEKGPQLDHAEAIRIVEQMARAVHHAHVHGLVHRDIKPHNILIAKDGQAFLADFGLAIQDDKRSASRGVSAGTPPYMAPEQVRGETHHIDGRADIWSLGVVLYRTLAGKLPFEAETLPRLVMAIQENRFKPPRQIDDSISIEAERVITKCLEKDVESRYSTAKDMADDLAACLNPATPPSSPAKPHPAVWVGAAALLLAAVWMIWFNRETPQPVNNSNSEHTVSDGELDGSIDLKREIKSPSAGEASIQTLSKSAAEFRIAGGDLLQLNAKLNRPAYLYLVWIEANGNVFPVYPWEDFDWNKRPESEKRVVAISSPNQSDGWPVGGPEGVETTVLLARDEPLPVDVDLKELLKDSPMLELPAELQLRGPRVSSAPRTIGSLDDDRRRQFLQSRLEEHFELIRTVSFANVGEVTPR